jgi:hypothetical protein
LTNKNTNIYETCPTVELKIAKALFDPKEFTIGEAKQAIEEDWVASACKAGRCLVLVIRPIWPEA